eukprot:ctg_1631.g498
MERGRSGRVSGSGSAEEEARAWDALPPPSPADSPYVRLPAADELRWLEQHAGDVDVRAVGQTGS